MKKGTFAAAVLNPAILDAATATAQTSQATETATSQTAQTTKDVSEVPTIEGQISEAAEKFIFAPLKNGATFPDALDFSKFVFNLLGVPKDLGGTEDKALSKNGLYCEAYEIIKAVHEKRTDKAVTTWAFIDQHYHKMVSPEKFKGNSEKTPIKAKSEKPSYTKEQQTTLDSLSNNPLLIAAYEATKAVFDADLENRIQVWVKETAENDRKSKMVFVKNFIRSCNDVAFLNSLYDLCKVEEAKTVPVPNDDDDNQPL